MIQNPMMAARYSGRCAVCGGAFAAGARIWYDPATRKTAHAACYAAGPAGPAGPAAPAPSSAPARRSPDRAKGEVVVSRMSKGRDDTWPEGSFTLVGDRYYVLVEPGKKYHEDDDDLWYIGAIARPATDEEAADRRARTTSRQKIKEDWHTLFSRDSFSGELQATSGWPAEADAWTKGYRRDDYPGADMVWGGADGFVYKRESVPDDATYTYRSDDPDTIALFERLTGSTCPVAHGRVRESTVRRRAYSTLDAADRSWWIAHPKEVQGLVDRALGR